ncbi:MAG TPA: hypothetical protein VHY19_02605 [Steroidobacteraceae bacterium]|jgi:hypothetical protein|nr:hypothetical protein [Steroidobacteraceae bacterium]
MRPPVGGSAGDERDPGREAIAQKLRDLPTEMPPPFDWIELRRRMPTKSTGSPVRARFVRALAQTGTHRARAGIMAGAVIVMAVLIGIQIEGHVRELAAGHPDAQRAQPLHPHAPPSAAPGSDADALLASAAGAERWLADRPDDDAVVRVSTHLAVATLEDRIASMDDQLNLERLQHAHPARLRALQLQRAQLVDSLAQVRYAEMLVQETP